MIVVLLVVRSVEASISAETNTPAYDSNSIDSRDDVIGGEEEDEDEDETGLIVTLKIQYGWLFAIS